VGGAAPTASPTVATLLPSGRMATVPQKELRNNIGEVLRRAESGEEITITVSGRPVAQLGPLRTRQWVDDSVLAELAALPADPTLAKDLEEFTGDLRDPWAGLE
jgi:prevent-host-death family protein